MFAPLNKPDRHDSRICRPVADCRVTTYRKPLPVVAGSR
jgi:hypothetical protein